jgi:hypothetical protein
MWITANTCGGGLRISGTGSKMLLPERKRRDDCKK